MSVIPEGHSLFVVDIEYIVPFAEIEPVLEPHMAFIAEGYGQGRFLASGPKSPRSGGVIIAIGASKDEVAALMAQDPFAIHEVARMTITEFAASNRHPVLK
ncbi:YciI family protein [Salipiger sp. P9]|uniref:YciI family protein n=1 Tax=Salipiger pentaromativorans TaxID=2943193 RepID=UPI0021587071|nr:YciI family protein [Salipiger pentaromativorans]MCR8549587.1 YciI family protein [Salipiger pentaromativorans]